MLFAARAGALEARGVFAMVSRESALVANNLLLSVAAFVVFIGTIWPLVAEIVMGRALSVGAPFFDAAFTPFMVALALILPVGAVMPWKRAEIGRSARPFRGAAALALALGLLVFALQTGRSALGPVGVMLAVWIVCGAGLDLWQRCGRGNWAVRLGRLGRLPRADWGRALAHAGLGLTIFGIAGMMAWVTEDIRVVQKGASYALGPYEVQLVDVTEVPGPNYTAERAEMRVSRAGRPVAVMYPEKRFYPVAGMTTTEAAIRQAVTGDLYLVIGDPQAGGGWAVRSYLKPFADWLWGGALLMALGGLLSLSDRRYRIAAAAARRPVAVAAE
jgi:cytochrome c-type biogenesis protein CcmF